MTITKYIYLITPFLTWIVTGIIKFLVNSLKAKKLAFNLIGYGGFPSNHSAIVTSMLTLTGIRIGFFNAPFGVALTLAFIVILDASSLRRQIAKQAVAINQINQNLQTKTTSLRERIGHTYLEIFAGILVGVLVAFLLG